MNHTLLPSRALPVALLIVLMFVVSRAALLVTSYDVNQNWEEPVFLFSATELQRDGLCHIFDHQDDLNHGGSVVLLLLAVPWVSAVGTSLVALKGVAIIWSTLTLCAFLCVVWRYYSRRAALLWGVLYLALSPTAARLNVTLVGSHPEALLPCALALAACLEWVRRGAAPSIRRESLDTRSRRATATRDARGVATRGEGTMLSEEKSGTPFAPSRPSFFRGRIEGSTFLLGWACGVALWVAYMSAMFVGPLLMLRLALVRRWRTVAALAVGLLLGLWPWIYQDLWLRPHGATLWMQHLAGQHAAVGIVQRWRDALAELATSFGYGDAGGAVMLAVCVLAWLVLTVGVAVPAWRAGWPWPPLAIVPLVMAPCLGFVMVANTYHPYHAVEGYYHYRFFIPLQVSLLLVLAVAIDVAAGGSDRLVLGAAVLVLGIGVWTQTPLYAQGNHYHADFAHDRSLGCHVYGNAEWDRAPNPAAAMTHLAGLSGAACQASAFSGLGWGIGGQYLETGNLDVAVRTLESIADPRLRWAACGGVLFVVSRAPEARVTEADRTAALARVAAYCKTFQPS